MLMQQIPRETFAFFWTAGGGWVDATAIRAPDSIPTPERLEDNDAQPDHCVPARQPGA